MVKLHACIFLLMGCCNSTASPLSFSSQQDTAGPAQYGSGNNTEANRLMGMLFAAKSGQPTPDAPPVLPVPPFLATLQSEFGPPQTAPPASVHPGIGGAMATNATVHRKPTLTPSQPSTVVIIFRMFCDSTTADTFVY